MTRILFCSVLALGLVATNYQVQEPKKVEKKVAKKPPQPSIPPTHGNVSYGKHERNVLDFWQAKSDKPTPVVICIHGGGWIGGDKSGYYGRVKTFLVSCAWKFIATRPSARTEQNTILVMTRSP